MIVNNLYPFENCLREGKDHETLIENIDIGGPSMIRAAAKIIRMYLLLQNRQIIRA